jgi:hypothetical protein
MFDISKANRRGGLKYVIQTSRQFVSPTWSTNARNLRNTGYLLCGLTLNRPCIFKVSAG